jgi:hypothetical protein
VVDRAAIAQGNAHHGAFCLIGCLFNGFGNFAGFTSTGADAATAVTDNHDRSEPHTTTTFNRFRYTVNSYEALDDFPAFAAFFAVARLAFTMAFAATSAALTTTFTTTFAVRFVFVFSRSVRSFCHFFFPLK